MKIFIDPGHNYRGADTGAQGNGIKEQDITFEIGIRLRELLENDGHSVKMSRGRITDSLGNTVAQSLKKRCDMANAWGADLFISIHTNAGGGRGTECYVYSKSSEAFKVAERIQNEITSRIKTVSRGVKEGKNLYVLKNTKAPAVLVETAFIDNEDDRKKLTERTGDFAVAIFTGITGKAAQNGNALDELCNRGIITDRALWEKKMNEDKNIYFLIEKMASYVRS